MHISVDSLSVSYGDFTAVRDLSVEIQRGEMLVLLGPSGCGKTSTMRSIIGLETPAAGSVSIGDRVMFDAGRGIDVPPNKRNVGMVFQSYAVWPHMTVEENVGFPLRMKKVGRDDARRRTTKALETVGLGHLAPRGASMLSGGQMQRVALARALVMEPDVLLFDEPLSNLDAKLREQLRVEIKEIQQQTELTAVYVTHDQSEALALADRIAVMRDGVIVQLDTPAQLYHAPRTTFVADFLGVSNIVRGRLSGGTGGTRTVRLDGADLEVAVAGTEVAAGAVSACLRPESLRVHRERPQAGHPNVWPATVTGESFMGTHTRYRVDLSGFDLDVLAFGAGQGMRRGDRVSVAIDPAEVWVLADTEAVEHDAQATPGETVPA